MHLKQTIINTEVLNFDTIEINDFQK